MNTVPPRSAAARAAAPQGGAIRLGAARRRITPIALIVLIAALLVVPWVPQLLYPVFVMKLLCMALFACAYGLLLGFGMMFPNRQIMLLIPPIPMKAKVYVMIFGALELWLGLRVNDGVAHFAHLGGMLGAFLMIRYWRGQPPFQRRRR